LITVPVIWSRWWPLPSSDSIPRRVETSKRFRHPELSHTKAQCGKRRALCER